MFFTNDRVYLYSLYGLGAVLWFVLYKTLSTVFMLVPALSFGRTRTAGYVLPFITLALSVGVVEFVRRNKKAEEFGVDVVVETKKVTWPNRKELQGSTLIVILMSVVVTVLIFILDKGFEFLIKLIF
jgi:preprotein translocase subunit SecE